MDIWRKPDKVLANRPVLCYNIKLQTMIKEL